MNADEAIKAMNAKRDEINNRYEAAAKLDMAALWREEVEPSVAYAAKDGRCEALVNLYSDAAYARKKLAKHGRTLGFDVHVIECKDYDGILCGLSVKWSES